MKEDRQVKLQLCAYPDKASQQLLEIRQLIIEVAQENKITDLVEVFRWGQPSYICKSGSTLRIDYASKSQKSVVIYLNCKSRLGEVIKEIYGDFFCYESNRAILFNPNVELPKAEIKQLIKMALNYHKLKNLPLLGA